jgi:hypothetical protein
MRRMPPHASARNSLRGVALMLVVGLVLAREGTGFAPLETTSGSGYRLGREADLAA